MKEVSLAVHPRGGTGTGAARTSRVQGNIPAIMYGPELEKPMPIAVNDKEFRTVMKGVQGGNAMFNLSLNGTVRKAILREIQRDKITSRVIHVDFHAISLTRPLHIRIPIHVSGTPLGVKNEGGVLQLTKRDVEISCLPADIPEFVEIDISNMNIGDSIHARDLNIPNAKILEDEDQTFVVVSAPTAAEATPAAAAAAEATLAAAAPAAGAKGAAPGQAPAKGAAPGAAPAKGAAPSAPAKKK